MDAAVASRIAALLTPWAGDDIALSREARLDEDLGLDALDRPTLAEEVEDEWDIEIGDPALERIATLGDLIDLVEAKTAGQSGRAV